ncbi:MAG: PHP domain-containing protein [candidate division Zixibacteria bacterium]|nr:PHP domain-containing protein [candidate division Zixibacteria bacterium]
MKQYVDLHLHTTCSDGKKTPSEVLDIVRKKNLVAFSITDHDSLDGYFAVRKLLKQGDPELIPGVEFSVSFEGGDLHLLAYDFDPDDKAINERLSHFQVNRNKRAQLMVKKLNELGLNISFEMVEKFADGASVGRPHVAQAIYESGAVKEYEMAFAKYIGNDKPGYVPKTNFSPQEAMDLIKNANGVAIMAHPVIDNNERFIEMMVKYGLDGIEVYHPYHKQRDTDRLKSLAERFRLIVSGGSDYHGRENRYGFIGSQKVPVSCFENIRRITQKRRESN